MSLNSSDAREFQLHPDREAPRRALEGFEVDPAVDVITLAGDEGSQEYREFQKGKLIDALTDLPLDATTVVVTREGKEVFREEGINDLFGVVFF